MAPVALSSINSLRTSRIASRMTPSSPRVRIASSSSTAQTVRGSSVGLLLRSMVGTR